MKLTSSSVALVTGGASGIGHAVAARLHAHGAAVARVRVEAEDCDFRFFDAEIFNQALVQHLCLFFYFFFRNVLCDLLNRDMVCRNGHL